MDPNSLCARNMMIGDNQVYGREREGPRTGGGVLENFYARGRGDVELISNDLHFAVELSAGNSGDLHFGTQ